MNKIIGTPSAIRVKLDKLNPEKEYVIKPYTSKRTDSQNRYIHLVFQAIGQEWGESMDDVKQYLKYKFLKDYREIRGIEICIIRGTSDLNKKQFSAFVEQVKEWAWTNLTMHIPSPDDKRLEDFYSEYKLTTFN